MNEPFYSDLTLKMKCIISKRNNDVDFIMSFSIEEALLRIPKEGLVDLIKELLYEKPKLAEKVLEWLNEKGNNADNTQKYQNIVDIKLNDNLILEYWEKAQKIISKFNKYGGGPEKKEEKAIDYLRKIVDFAQKNPISQEAKEEFIEECFNEYNKGNSGLDDFLLEAIEDVCDSMEDWKFVVENLKDNPTTWNKKRINDIQRKYLS